MAFTTKGFNQATGGEGKNGQFIAPPGVFTQALTAAAAVKNIAFKNYTQYVHIENTGAGALRIGFCNVALKGINGAGGKDNCYYEIPSGSIFAAPMQVSKIYFKAVADTIFSLAVTFTEQLADGSELNASGQFDMVEELDPARTDF